jgi:hypothetical protein
MCPFGQSYALELAIDNSEFQMNVEAMTSTSAGTWTISAWAFVSSDYDGTAQLLHSRLYNSAGADIGTTSGGWPGSTDVFEYIEVSVAVSEIPTDWNVYIGYTGTANTKGFRYITDIKLIDPDGKDWCEDQDCDFDGGRYASYWSPSDSYGTYDVAQVAWKRDCGEGCIAVTKILGNSYQAPVAYEIIGYADLVRHFSFEFEVYITSLQSSWRQFFYVGDTYSQYRLPGIWFRSTSSTTSQIYFCVAYDDDTDEGNGYYCGSIGSDYTTYPGDGTTEMGGGFSGFETYQNYRIQIITYDYQLYFYVNTHLIYTRSLSTATRWDRDMTNMPVYMSYGTAPDVQVRNVYYADLMTSTCAPSAEPTGWDSRDNWVLVLRQNSLDNGDGKKYFSGQDEAESCNTDDPDADLYSIMSTIEDYRDSEGKFTFKWVWPTLSSSTNPDFKNYNIWKQTDNPTETTQTGSHSSITNGYEELDVTFDMKADGTGFTGLYKTQSTSSTRWDGDPGNCWFFAIGSYSQWSYGLPGPIADYTTSSTGCDVNGGYYWKSYSNSGCWDGSNTCCYMNIGWTELYVLMEHWPTSLPTPSPTTAGMGWTNCPDVTQGVKEDINGADVTDEDGEDQLVISASCSAGSSCATIKYSFSAVWDFTLSSLVYFNFEDMNQAATDESVNGYSIEMDGDVAYSSSYFRYGANSLWIPADASNDGLKIDDDTGFTWTSEATVAMYMMPSGWAGSHGTEDYHWICWLGIDGNNNIKVYWYAGTLYFKLTTVSTDGSGDYTTTELTLTDDFSVYDGAWTHFALTMELSDAGYTIYTYLDGAIDTKTMGSWSLDSSWEFNGAKLGYGLEAYVDNVAVWGIALGEDQVEVLEETGSFGGLSPCIASYGGKSSPFEVGETSGEVSLISTENVDYEVCTGFMLTAVATDSFSDAKITCTFSVDVSDENDAPTMKEHTYITVEERTPKQTEIGERLNATDPDFGQAILFTLNGSTATENDMFGIGKCSGQVYVNRDDLDFKEQNYYELYIQAQDDGDPAAADYGWVHINVTNVNDAPYFSNTSETFLWYENMANGSMPSRKPYAPSVIDPDPKDTLQYYMDTDIDTAPFKIDRDTGVLTAVKSLNYEDRTFYVIDIRVTDGSLMAVQDFYVYIEDQNDPPTLEVTHKTVAENSAEGSSVGSRVAADDEDSGDSIDYVITGGNLGYYTTEYVPGPDDDQAEDDGIPIGTYLKTFRISSSGQIYVNDPELLD